MPGSDRQTSACHRHALQLREFFLMNVLRCYLVGAAEPGAAELAARLAALGLEVVGRAVAVDEACAEIPPLRPDLVVAAARLEGLERLRLLGNGRGAPVLFFGAEADAPPAGEPDAADWRALLDGASDLIQCVDAAGRLLWANRAWCETLGYVESAVPGLEWARLLHADSAGPWREACARLRPDGPAADFAAVLVARDGRPVTVEGRVQARGAAGGVRAIFREVAEVREAGAAGSGRAEAALRERETLLASINANLEGTCVFRIEHGPDGSMQCLYVSPTIEAMIGVPAERFRADGAAVFGLIHPEDLDGFRRALAAALAAEASLVHTVRIRPAGGGGERWVEFRSHLTARRADGVQIRDGVAVDLTALRTAELQLRRQGAFFAALHQITVELLGRPEQAELLQTIARRSADLFGAAQVELDLVEGEELVTRAFHGAEVSRLGQRATRAEAPLSWQVVDRREPVVLTDYADSALARAPYRELGLTAAAIFPILQGGQCVGTLGVARIAPGAGFGTEEITQGRIFAQLSALVLHQAGIYAEARRDADRRTADLRGSEARFRALVENVSQGYYVADRRGLFTYCNAAVAAVVGRSEAELAGTSVFRLVAAEDRAHVIAAYRAWAAGPQTEASLVFRIPTVLGRMIWVEQVTTFLRDEAGQVQEFRCLLRDITERRAAEERLRESEELFHGVFEASPIPILLSTAPEGRLIEANAAALRTFGYERGEVIGGTTEALGLWVRAEQRREFFRRIAAERTVGNFESTMRTKAGAERVMLCTGTLLHLGGQTRVLASAVDITALRQAEAEQAALRERALVAQKHEALGTLAGGVAHDFNNILTGVLNYTQLAQWDCPPTHPQVREFLDEVIKCGLRAKELVRQILLFSRAESSERVAVPLAHAVQEALALLRATIPTTVLIHADLADSSVAVLGNATQLQQVVMNLGINAAQAMQEQGGTLTVRLHPHLVDAALCAELAGLRPGPHFRLEVVDTGHGIAPADLPRIFEPFFTTKPVGEGTGLGLAVVHSILRTHGAAVRVRSTVGRGTAFELFFPLLDAATLPDEDERPPAPRGRGQRLLLVDDEPAIGQSVKLILERLGYAVSAFTDPRAALAHWEAAAADYDAVVSDVQMPGLTGFMLAERILAVRPGLPIFLLSGFAGTDRPERLRAAGVTEFLRKPINFDELARVLARRLG